MKTALVLLVLATVSTSAVRLGKDYRPYPPRTNCLVSNDTLERFRHITFYSWHTRTGNWSQIGQASDYQELIEFHTMTGRSSMLEAQSIFFKPIPANAGKGPNGHPLRGLTIREDWKEKWMAVVNTLTNASVNGKGNLIQMGIIKGFMLGDELMWNNITWPQLNETANAIKASFPQTYTMYTEGGAALYAQRNINGYHQHYPHVPMAIDFMSSDDYGTMYKYKNPQWFYDSFVYPFVKAKHQSVWVIPPSFKVGKHQRGNLTSDEWCLNQTYGYLDWIEQDQCITGSDAFYFDIAGGLLELPKTLECWQQVSAQMIQYQKDHPLILEEEGAGNDLEGAKRQHVQDHKRKFKCPHA